MDPFRNWLVLWLSDLLQWYNLVQWVLLVLYGVQNRPTALNHFLNKCLLLILIHGIKLHSPHESISTVGNHYVSPWKSWEFTHLELQPYFRGVNELNVQEKEAYGTILCINLNLSYFALYCLIDPAYHQQVYWDRLWHADTQLEIHNVIPFVRAYAFSIFIRPVVNKAMNKGDRGPLINMV